MSDELDKFVLQYTVDLKDSISRLEKLNAATAKTNAQASKTMEGFKEFAKGATDELGKIVPGVDRVTSAVKLMGAEFALASLAVGALAIGIKAVMDMREQYNAQRKEGMQTGVSSMRLEEYQRKFTKGSSGNVTRETTASEVKKFSDFVSTAYSDPTRMGTEARRLKMLGIDPGERGKGSTPVNEALTRLADTFSHMTSGQVQGVAKSMGMDQDFALTLQKLGPSIGRVTEMTAEEIKTRDKAQTQLVGFNDAVAKMNEQFKEAENALAQKLLPSLTKLVEVFAKIASYVPAVVKGLGGEDEKPDDKKNKSSGLFSSEPQSIWGNIKQFGLNPMGLIMGTALSIGKSVAKEQNRQEGAKTPEGMAAAKTDKQIADKLMDGADTINKEGIKAANDMNLAVNMFAGAVSAFSNAIDEKQAWAAWAGEVGRAAGLGTTPPTDRAAANSPVFESPVGGPVSPFGPTKYDEFFKKASDRYGVDENLLKSVAKVESHFDPKAKSEQGAVGLMQLLPSIGKAYGLTDLEDPQQNIMGGARLLAENMRATGGDIKRSLLMYHGGTNEKNWGPKTQAYPGKVLGSQGLEGSAAYTKAADGTLKINPRGGESREKINLRMVQANIAEKLGVPLQQIQQGGINRGDVEWRLSQMEGGIQNNITGLQRQLQYVGLPQQTRSKIMTEIRDQQRGLSLMQQYGGEVVDRAQEGPRSITVGERAVIININGAQNPALTAQAVGEHLSTHIADIVNGSATGLKY